MPEHQLLSCGSQQNPRCGNHKNRGGISIPEEKRQRLRFRRDMKQRQNVSRQKSHRPQKRIQKQDPAEHQSECPEGVPREDQIQLFRQRNLRTYAQ